MKWKDLPLIYLGHPLHAVRVYALLYLMWLVPRFIHSTVAAPLLVVAIYDMDDGWKEVLPGFFYFLLTVVPQGRGHYGETFERSQR